MKVRLLGDHDDAEWLRMRDALWPEIPPAEHEREMADYRGGLTKAVFVVDRGDGQLGGFLEAATRESADGCETSPVGYIEGWYVDPDLRCAAWRSAGRRRRRRGPATSATRKWPVIACSRIRSASRPIPRSVTRKSTG